MERVVAYVDGFNLYFGLKSKGWRRYYWLDIPGLIGRLLLPDQRLIETKYFTSRVSASATDRDKPKRQNAFLEALQTRPDLLIYFGHYLQQSCTCTRCGATWRKYAEKMTDVNIATELLTDAFQNRFDTALLVSGDSDLTAPIHAVRKFFPEKRVVVAFPPDRRSVELANAASTSFHIGRA
ncbi:MAG: NYN domain-containing protein, partial [Thermoguttaceae bacterium]